MGLLPLKFHDLPVLPNTFLPWLLLLLVQMDQVKLLLLLLKLLQLRTGRLSECRSTQQANAAGLVTPEKPIPSSCEGPLIS